MKLLFIGACLLVVLAVEGAKNRNVNCGKLQRKCNKGNDKSCRKLRKLCSDFLNRQQHASESSHNRGSHVPAALADVTIGAPSGIFVEQHGLSVEVTWLPPESGATISGYLLSYGEYIPDQINVRLGADVTNYVIHNVSPNVIYIMKLRTFTGNEYGPSIFQTIMTTDGELPEPPAEDIDGQLVQATDEETTNNQDEDRGDDVNIFQHFGTTETTARGGDGSHQTL